MDSIPLWSWVKRIFSSWWNSLVTISLVYFLMPLLIDFVHWGLVSASFGSGTRSDCDTTGACWLFVHAHLKLFIYGMYPSEQIWRECGLFMFFLNVLS